MLATEKPDKNPSVDKDPRKCFDEVSSWQGCNLQVAIAMFHEDETFHSYQKSKLAQ